MAYCKKRAVCKEWETRRTLAKKQRKPALANFGVPNHSPLDENWSSLFLNKILNVVSDP